MLKGGSFGCAAEAFLSDACALRYARNKCIMWFMINPSNAGCVARIAVLFEEGEVVSSCWLSKLAQVVTDVYNRSTKSRSGTQ